MALLRKCVESEEQEPYNLSHLQSLTCWENEADIDEHDCDALWSFINLMGSIRTPRLQVSRGLYRVVQAEDVADEAEVRKVVEGCLVEAKFDSTISSSISRTAIRWYKRRSGSSWRLKTRRCGRRSSWWCGVSCRSERLPGTPRSQASPYLNIEGLVFPP